MGLESLLGPVGLGIGLAADIGKTVFGIGQNKKANEINPVFNAYVTSPYAKMQLGTAQNAYNGRMAGAASQEQNIARGQANAMYNVGRNATDSSQALALGSLSQGQANNAYTQLGVQEQQNKYTLLNNLNTAYGAMVGEGDKVYNSMLQKYQMDTQQQQELRNSGAQNVFGGITDFGAGLIKAGNLYNSPYSEVGQPHG